MSEVVEELIRTGVKLLRENDLDAAQSKFEELLELDAESALAYSNLGMIELLKQRPHFAIKHLEKAIELDDRLFHAYLNLGSAYFVTGDLTKYESLGPGFITV